MLHKTNKIISANFIILGLLMVFLNGCSSYKTYETLEEAIEKDIPYKVKEIIHIEPFTDHAIVFYITPAQVSSQQVDAIAVAFFYTDSENRWKNKLNGYTYNEGDLTVYYESAAYFDLEADRWNRIDVLFGQINNLDIVNVEAGQRQENLYSKTQIIEGNSGRYFFILDYYDVIRGLNVYDEIIFQFGN